MSGRSASVDGARAAAAELLRTMFADVDGARARAASLLDEVDDLVAHSYARQVIGIAHREHGDTASALRELREAVRAAERGGDSPRRADAQATLGATLAVAGRTREGIRHLDEAVAVLTGKDRATALTRRGWTIITLQGRFAEGASDMAEAIELFSADGDDVWLARALNLLGYACLFLGDLDAADRHFRSAGSLYAELGNDPDLAVTVQNRGYVSFLRGDLPRTFAMLGRAASTLEAAGGSTADLVIDRCAAYLSAGLLPEASSAIEDALARGGWVGREEAELLHTRARVALAAGDLELAERTATQATRRFRTQGREWYATRAELVALTARHRRVQRISPALRRDALALVERSRRLRVPEHVEVLLRAASIVEGHDPKTSDDLLREAERAKRHDAALTSALGWLATARRSGAAGRTGATLRACEAGLSAIDEHQRLLGSGELRARASAHGEDLAALALRSALAVGRAELVLHWIERWRSTATVSPAPGHLDDETARDLAALRARTQQVDADRDAGKPTEQLQRQVAALERRIRERTLLRTGSTADPGDARADVSDVLATLADSDTTLLELFALDGVLHAVVAHRGRVDLSPVGPLDRAVQAQGYAGFVLRRAGRGRPAGLEEAGSRLQSTLLGGLDLPGDGPVVVSAPNQLQRLPWALLPALSGRAVSSAPSAKAWLRASRQDPASSRRTFIVGPGLASGGAEVEAIRRSEPSATYLTGPDATVDAALAQLDGARLVHVAAHGSFRKDNPLFSTLDLADGPLVVHDLEGLGRPPHRVVLSACETGDMEPVGADELLGLSASLLAMGSAGVVSSLVQVHDHATAEVMAHVHDALRGGHTGAEALLHARLAAGEDALLHATAVSFTAFGT